MKQSPPWSPPPDFAWALEHSWNTWACAFGMRVGRRVVLAARKGLRAGSWLHTSTRRHLTHFLLEHFSFHIARPRSYISCVYRLPPVSFYRSRTMDTEPALYNSCTGVFLPVTCIAPTGTGNKTSSIPVPVGPVKTWSDHACSPPCEQTSFVQRLCEYGSHEGTNGSAARTRGWTASAHAHG